MRSFRPVFALCCSWGQVGVVGGVFVALSRSIGSAKRPKRKRAISRFVFVCVQVCVCEQVFARSQVTNVAKVGFPQRFQWRQRRSRCRPFRVGFELQENRQIYTCRTAHERERERESARFRRVQIVMGKPGEFFEFQLAFLIASRWRIAFQSGQVVVSEPSGQVRGRAIVTLVVMVVVVVVREC